MEQIAYSFHLGSDKNRKSISKTNSKNNISGTSSLSNNAIQNARQLKKLISIIIENMIIIRN